MADPTKGYRRIKRASRACQHCHSRKVRCDATVSGFPCTDCRLDRIACLSFHSARDRKQLSLVHAQALVNKSAEEGRPPSSSQDELAVPLTFSSYPFIEPIALERLGPAKASFLQTQGCLSLPRKSEMDVFLRQYFLYVHPFAPLLDEAAFCRAYRCPPAGTRQISVLLLRAMIFSASCFVSADVAKRCGYASLLGARDGLYRKAKLLFESGIEEDPLTLSRAALLLTYYSSDFEVNTNSEWLRIAVKQVGIAQVRQTNRRDRPCSSDQTDLKRVWWCCLIRDRIISLGMRRPIQITVLYPAVLTRKEMDDEMCHSMVYKYETKSALFELFVSLCRFVMVVTRLATVAYPRPGSRAVSTDTIEDPCDELRDLDRAKADLLLWELDWMAHMDGRNFNLHASIPLFASLLSIYYQSARVALCNRVCLILNQTVDYTTRYLQQLEFCRSELAAAIMLIADKVKHIVRIKAVDKLPISIQYPNKIRAAYTTTPYILLSINSQSQSEDVAQSPDQDTLVLFSAVNQALGLRYHVTRLSHLTDRALWLCQHLRQAPVSSQTSIRGPGAGSIWNIFTLPLQQYSRLLHYIDQSMSIPQGSIQETGVLYAAAARSCEAPGTQDSSRQSREPTPVWMEAMENFFCGPGRSLSLPSSSSLSIAVEISEQQP
ncbi:hypothetical protein BDV11DRAFT_211553 [Aspergillus similis]